MNKTTIDIVLPCYNPLEDWVETVVDRVGQLNSHFSNFDFNCIVVNDGSSKHVKEEDVARLQEAIPSLIWISYDENRGKGFALRKGIGQTKSDVVMYTDIDLPYKMESMINCLNPVISGEADLSVAVRNESYYKLLPTRRRYLSKMLRSLNRSILGLKTSDTQGGLKVISHKAKAKFLSTTIDRYLFDLEFVYLCSKDDGIIIQAVESDMRENISFSKTPLSILFKEGLNFLTLLFRR